MDVEPLKRCICGAEVDQDECPYPSGRRTSVDGRAMYVVNCTNNECGWQCLGWGADGARKAWNTRHGAGDAEAWRSIESAPRDGERIILGRPDIDGDGGGISVAGYWLEELEDGVDYMGNDGGFTDVDFQVFQPGRSFGAESYRYAGSQPTHWRPLPPPPTDDAARAGERGVLGG